MSTLSAIDCCRELRLVHAFHFACQLPHTTRYVAQIDVSSDKSCGATAAMGYLRRNNRVIPVARPSLSVTKASHHRVYLQRNPLNDCNTNRQALALTRPQRHNRPAVHLQLQLRACILSEELLLMHTLGYSLESWYAC